MPPQRVVNLPLEQKVGQLVMAGFDGTTPTDELLDLIAEYNLGSVIYFSRNVETPAQVAALSRALQAEATAHGTGEPLFIATDQEGGVVSRLDWGSQLPSQMLLGACGDADLAREAGVAVGRELRSLGISMNLAPVLDVNNNPDNPVIGVRSFGEAPEAVAELGAAVATGMQSAGVLACGKHFPGHGDTATDSHVGLPVVDHERDRLDRVEFVPFRRAIEAGIDAIMTTHVSFPAITGETDRPATIAPSVQTGLLRDQFGFDGLVVTDCLEMDAIAAGVGTADGAVQAIEAGCDVLIVSHTPARQRAAIEAVVEAVETGRLSEDRIDASVRRIHEYRQRRNIGTAVPESPTSDNADTGGGGHPWEACAASSKQVARRVADCGVTLVRDDPGVLPFDTDRPLSVVGFNGDRGSSAEDDRYHPGLVSDALRDAGVDVRAQTVRDPADGDVTFEGDAQVLVACYDARSNPDQAACVRTCCRQPVDLAVLAVRNPYDLVAVPEAETYLTTYGYSPSALAAAADVLVGESKPGGTLPVSIPTE